MEEQKDMVLEVENLNVKFVMEEETVEAVNNISLHIKKGKPWDWWERPVQEKPQQHCPL